jgi:transcriptional regulator with AAA-type ATPase domain
MSKHAKSRGAGPAGATDIPRVPEFKRWQASRSLVSDSLGPLGELLGFAEKSGYDVPPKGTIGLFKVVHGGTLFVDEFGEMSDPCQVVFLDVCEGKEVSPYPRGTPYQADIHLVFATNKPLKGRIRQELINRIQTTIRIPNLRDRPEDVFDLVRHKLKGTGYDVDFRTWLLLTRYRWPANVRELFTVVESAVAEARATDETKAPRDSTGRSSVHSPDADPNREGPGTDQLCQNLPFNVFAHQKRGLESVAENLPRTESEAFYELVSWLEDLFRGRGFKKGDQNQPLDKKIAEKLWITKYKMSRMRRASEPNSSRPPSSNDVARERAVPTDMSGIMDEPCQPTD